MTNYGVCGVYFSEPPTEVYCVRLNFNAELGLLFYYTLNKKNGTLVLPFSLTHTTQSVQT